MERAYFGARSTRNIVGVQDASLPTMILDHNGLNLMICGGVHP